MFNAAQKEEYLQQNEGRNTNLRNTAGSIFNSINKYETEINKDAAEWTVAEIITYYKDLATSSFVSLSNRHSQLKKYAEWCLDNNMIRDNQNHYLEIDIQTLRGCLNVGRLKNGILTRKEMEHEIAQLLNPREQCLVYALFEGVQGKEFSELTDLNMNQVKGNTLRLANRQIIVHPKLIDLMQEATDEYIYYTYGDKQRQYPFDNTDTNVFKKTYNSKQESQIRKRQRLYSTLVRIKDYLGNPAINAASLMESGRIDMIKDYMKKDNTDVVVAIQNHAKEIENKYGKIGRISTYMDDYGEFY